MKYACWFFVLASSSSFSQDAWMFRGNPQHTGIYSSAPLAHPGRLKWKFAAEGAIVSSAAVAGETVYVGSADHHLYAINRASGVLRWKFKTGGRVSSSPAVVDGVVYVGSYDGNLYALDAVAGSVKWQFQTQGERRFGATHLHGANPPAEQMPDPFDVYLSSPAVVQNHVYFGSGDGNVYALDATAGTLVWKFNTGDVVHSSPAFDDGVIFVGSWDSYFYALDAATGRQKWRFKTGVDPKIHNQVGIQSSPAVGGGLVFFGCRDSNFYALDERTGQQRWAFNNKGSWVVGSPALTRGKVYFATSDSSKFYELDAASGAELFSLSFKTWPLFSSPAIAGTEVYLGSNEGKLFAIDLTGHRVSWSFQTEGSKLHGRTYTKPDGTPNYEAAFAGDFYDDIVIGVYKMFAVGTILASPVIVDSVLYVGSTDGNFYALQ